MDPTDVMHSCVLSMELLLYLALAAHNICEHMWLVRWITAPHLRLDLAVENANAKNVIFLRLAFALNDFRRACSMLLILSLLC